MMKSIEFFVLRQNVESPYDTFAERMEPIYRGDHDFCSTCGQAMSSKKWIPPYKVEIKSGIKGDLIFVSHTHLVVSNKFREHYLQSGLKGIRDFQKVNFFFEGKKLERDYLMLTVVRGSARVDEKLSGFKRNLEGQKYCPVCQTGGVIESLKGVVIDKGSWNGDDIFYAYGFPGEIIVTEKFRAFLEAHSFFGADCIEADTYIPAWVFP